MAKDGSLVVETAFGAFRETKPLIYQDVLGKRVPVDGRFALTGDSEYSFRVENYHREFALVIDPSLLYSTYLGQDQGALYVASFGFAAIAVDAYGDAYVAGTTVSNNFPTTSGSYEPSVPGAELVAFVSKLAPAGNSLIYSTFLYGTSGSSGANAIAVDSTGAAYVAGPPGVGFPTTSGAYQTACSSNIFFTKLTPDGSGLSYSTCFGGAGAARNGDQGDAVEGVALDAAGKAYIAGYSDGNVPTTPNAIQSAPSNSTWDAFVAVFDPSQSGASSLLYSTYLGGNGGIENEALGIAVDSYGGVYVTGFAGPNFPTTPGAYQTTIPSGAQSVVFAVKLNPSVAGPAGLIYSTYIGTVYARGYGIAVDPNGNAYVGGAIYQVGTGSFPSTPGAYQACSNGDTAFVTKLNSGGSGLLYSTCFNGSSSASAYAIALDSTGQAWVTASGAYTGFPVTPNAFQTQPSPNNAFLTGLNSTGTGLVYSSFLGPAIEGYWGCRRFGVRCLRHRKHRPGFSRDAVCPSADRAAFPPQYT